MSNEADSILRSEKLFSDTMVESMPGTLYFYDRAGRFLRWNRNFEVVSGFGPDEIAGMHPLDFFAAEDRPEVEARIEQVFRSGESTIEVPFVSKAGTRTPYFFTGRRVEFEGRPCLVGVGIDISDRVRTERGWRTASGVTASWSNMPTASSCDGIRRAGSSSSTSSASGFSAMRSRKSSAGTSSAPSCRPPTPWATTCAS